uniref:Serpentine receptor class gamma n=1 Tax=Heterorhabditis bacteriophora TaxID=37862 RepID=A0A1I7WZE0_HETBA
MDNFTLFDDHNDALLLFYNINSPVCIFLNLLAIYLIVFKSSKKMGEYRWYLLHYQIWVSAFDIFVNVLFQPAFFFPISAGTGHGFLITKVGFPTCTCVYIYLFLPWGIFCSIASLFFYRHQSIVEKQYKVSHKKLISCLFLLLFGVALLQFISFLLSEVDPSLWPELLRKVFKMKIIFIYIIILSKTQKLWNYWKFLIFTTCLLRLSSRYTLQLITQSLFYGVAIPSLLVYSPSVIIYMRIFDGRLGLQILNDILMMMLSVYGVVATIFLIFCNTSYREFLSEKLRKFAASRKRCPLESSESTGINGNPQVPSLVNSTRAGELPSQSSNCSADFSIFVILCNRLETVALSTASYSASSSWVCDGLSSNNDFKASVFAVRDVPECCRSLTSKSPGSLIWRNKVHEKCFCLNKVPNLRWISNLLLGKCYIFSFNHKRCIGIFCIENVSFIIIHCMYNMTFFVMSSRPYFFYNIIREIYIITKDQFARDDPAFLVLLSLSLFFSSVFYAVALHLSTWGFIKFFFWVIFIDCIGIGLIVATSIWWLSNRFLRKVKDQDVEWGYCFDVHLNAFFPMLILLHVLLPIIYTQFVDSIRFFPILLGNTIWFMAAMYYVYITFLGYTVRYICIRLLPFAALPILHKTQVFLYPITFLFILWVATVTAGWNVSRSAMGFYHYRAESHDIHHLGF